MVESGVGVDCGDWRASVHIRVRATSCNGRFER